LYLTGVEGVKEVVCPPIFDPASNLSDFHALEGLGVDSGRLGDLRLLGKKRELHEEEPKNSAGLRVLSHLFRFQQSGLGCEIQGVNCAGIEQAYL
jgi:hypothetical protein